MPDVLGCAADAELDVAVRTPHGLLEAAMSRLAAEAGVGLCPGRRVCAPLVGCHRPAVLRTPTDSQRSSTGTSWGVRNEQQSYKSCSRGGTVHTDEKEGKEKKKRERKNKFKIKFANSVQPNQIVTF